MTPDFLALTEIAGDDVTTEQVERLARRYYWAEPYCRERDVVEVACGTGQGVGHLARHARSMAAGDYTEPLLAIARRHYGARFDFQHFDAQQMPFADRSRDVIVIFEALYYIPSLDRFFAECARVLRPGGVLLIASANKDLFDFNPSPDSYRYLGVCEFEDELARFGFATTCYGDTPVGKVSARQQLLRPVKAMAARLGLIPKSMKGKKLLKRLVFGGLVPMPAEITAATAPAVAPTPLPAGRPDTDHKVIFCVATLVPDGPTPLQS